MAASYTLFYGLLFLLPAFALAASPPVELQHRGYAREKHCSMHSFRLTISNGSERPVWFVLVDRDAEPFPKGDVFKSHVKDVFNATRWKGEGGLVVEICMWGQFSAFRLPPRGSLEIPDYAILVSVNNLTTTKQPDFHDVVVLEAPELLVNGKIPLEGWLPFRTICDKTVRLVEGEGYTKGLDWYTDKKGQRRGYPSDNVQYVEARGARRWTVKFQPKGEFDSRPYPLRNRTHL